MQAGHHLNPMLLARRGIADDQRQRILDKHSELDVIVDRMDALSAEAIGELRQGALEIERVEFELQALWGFPANRSRHSHWKRPRAVQCDRYFNDEMWTRGIFVRAVRRTCPIFGDGGLRPEGVNIVIQVEPEPIERVD